MRILADENRRDTPFAQGTEIYPFDQRTFTLGGLEEGKPSAETVIPNRPPRHRDAHGRYIWGGILKLFAETLPIFPLRWQNSKERVSNEHWRESEAGLEEAQSVASCGSWVWNPIQNTTHWSDEMYRILGLVPQSVPASWHLIHPHNNEFHAARMKAAFYSGDLYTAEHRIVRPNGEMRTVVESGRPKYDSQHRPTAMIGTVLDITEARQAEKVLRESEERFRTMADVTPIMMWTADIEKLRTDFNRSWLKFTGRPIDREIGEGWSAAVHPDDLQKCMSSYAEAFEERRPFTMEYRLRACDGVYRWISDAGSPRFLSDGSFAGYIGCCVDIHDRKEVELERQELAGRLMNAQELERARIARELHDGIGQQIALLSIQMQRAFATVCGETGQIYSGMQKLSSTLASIALDVSCLSHQLHSSELEYLGLSAAITGLCRQFAEEYSIEVACVCKSIPADLANATALSLFRVVQESLHNVAKHSKATAIKVEATCAPTELLLLVRDNGAGFDAREARTAAGLGLISMRERVALIGGEFLIDSKPGFGTTVQVRIPLTRETLCP